MSRGAFARFVGRGVDQSRRSRQRAALAHDQLRGGPDGLLFQDRIFEHEVRLAGCGVVPVLGFHQIALRCALEPVLNRIAIEEVCHLSSPDERGRGAALAPNERASAMPPRAPGDRALEPPTTEARSQDTQAKSGRGEAPHSSLASMSRARPGMACNLRIPDQHEHPRTSTDDFDKQVRSFEHWFESVEGYLSDLEHGHARVAAAPLDAAETEQLINVLCSYCVGEAAALEASSGLVRIAPNHACKIFLATQAVDEARHLEVLHDRMRELWREGSGGHRRTLCAAEHRQLQGQAPRTGRLSPVGRARSSHRT